MTQSQYIFSFDPAILGKYKLRGKPVSFVYTNIPSYQGSRLNLWKSSKGNIGVQDPYGN